MFESASISRLRTCYKIMIVEGMIFAAIGAVYSVLWYNMSADEKAAAGDNYKNGFYNGLSGLLMALFSFHGFRQLNSNRSSAIRWSAFTLGICTSILLVIGAVQGLWIEITGDHDESQGYFSLILTCLSFLALLTLHVFTGYAGLKVFMEMKDGGPSADGSALLEENDVY